MRYRSGAVASHPSGPQGLRLYPVVALLLLTIASLIHLPLIGLAFVNPAFAVMGIFYFTLLQPRLMPYAAVFLCGLIYDAYQSTLFGTHALLFLCLRVAVARVRIRTGFVEPPLLNWMYFSVTATVYLAAEWLAASLQSTDYHFNVTVVERAAGTLLTYPPVWFLLSRSAGFFQIRG